MPRIIISHYSFHIDYPYRGSSLGDWITEEEAAALNWFRMDAIRNIILRRLGKHPPGYILSPSELTEYQTWIDDICRKFKFKTKPPTERKSLLDIEREVVAREYLFQISHTGDYSDDDLERSLKSCDPQIETEARRRLQSRLRIASPEALGVK